LRTRPRVGRNRWFNLLWLLPIGFVVLISAVAVAQGLRTIPSVEDFIARYSGTIVSAEAQENAGFPAWVGVQHFLNLFLMIFILGSGLQILSDHPRYVLLFATGHWRRVVPTSWDVLPNALSVQIQYLSLQWPAEHGWVASNSLQLIAYFITIFIAAPAALITGLGMSPALSTRFKRLSRVLSIQTARSLHFSCSSGS
jgi:hypothetical protein